MKEYIFLRYGNTPNPQVTAVLGNGIVKPGTQPIFNPMPGIMITVFKSDLSETEIRSKLEVLNILYDLVEKKNAVRDRETTNTHNPNRPSKESLNAKLQQALDVENFEKAAEIRDEIERLYGTSEGMITSISQFRYILENNNNLETQSKDAIIKNFIMIYTDDDEIQLLDINSEIYDIKKMLKLDKKTFIDKIKFQYTNATNSDIEDFYDSIIN